MPTIQLTHAQCQRQPHQHRYQRTYILRSAAPAPSSRLTRDQIERLHRIVTTYAPDLHDPAAVEVLLVLLEVCRIIEPAEEVQAAVFGLRLLEHLAAWGDAPAGRQRPAQLRRAWVWLPNEQSPQLLPIAGDGTVWVYPHK
jgi:hypothetical protein